jgi:hypothetical protein
VDERSIVLYLNRKGLTAEVVHDDLAATLGEEATAYSRVTNCLRASPMDESDENILRALEELPFS